MSNVPDLEHGSNSWICSWGSARVELYERANVEKLAARGWRVETAGQYLARLNHELSVNEHRP